mmetsp:Transcript_15012/g.31842  ORF Transcript_15012/g.31842 Transcript_15012/m.31842 type:complete len:202 (-) Transcript_15012:46-651(-)
MHKPHYSSGPYAHGGYGSGNPAYGVGNPVYGGSAFGGSVPEEAVLTLARKVLIMRIKLILRSLRHSRRRRMQAGLCVCGTLLAGSAFHAVYQLPVDDGGGSAVLTRVRSASFAPSTVPSRLPAVDALGAGVRAGARGALHASSVDAGEVGVHGLGGGLGAGLDGGLGGGIGAGAYVGGGGAGGGGVAGGGGGGAARTAAAP